MISKVIISYTWCLSVLLQGNILAKEEDGIIMEILQKNKPGGGYSKF